jgi:hypothetical protein
LDDVAIAKSFFRDGVEMDDLTTTMSFSHNGV